MANGIEHAAGDLQYVGRSSSGSFAVVDVGARTIDKLPSALPRSTGCDQVYPRAGWIAVDGQDALWSVSPRFDADPVRIASTFLKVPRRDGQTMWVRPKGGEHADRILAVDGARAIHAELQLPEGWTSLEADLDGVFVVSRRSEDRPGIEVAALYDEGDLRVVASAGMVLAAHGRHVAWVRTDSRSPERLVFDHIAITDLASTETVDVSAPEIVGWHSFGSFSPDGSWFAIGGYVDPDPKAGMSEKERNAYFLRTMGGGEPWVPRRSVMAIIDVATGAARAGADRFDGFASTPLWTSDSRTVIFTPPFEDRRVCVLDVGSMEMRSVSLRRSALTPLVVWNGDDGVEGTEPERERIVVAEPAPVVTEDPEFTAALAEAGLEKFASQIVALDRMSFRLHGSAMKRDDEVVGVSRLGGRPDLAADVAWPEWNGAPLAFVAQVSLASLPTLPDSPLPADGLLSFFYDAVTLPTGFDPAHRGGWRLIHQPAGAALSPRAFPAALAEQVRFDPVALTAVAELTHAPWESAEFDAVPLSRDQQFAYADLLDAPEGLSHRLLGHPDPIQGDMQLECQLVSHGLYLGDSSGRRDPRAADLRAGAKDWRLVLQIDSDDDAGMNWLADGRLYVFMTEDALAHRRWAESWLVCQFT